MVALRINVFGGMIPIQDDRLLPDGGAALAENTWMYSGALDGMKSPRLVRNLVNPAATRVYRIPSDPYSGDTFNTSVWMEFQDIDVEVLRAPVRDDSYRRFYWVGPNTVPTYNTYSRIATGNSAYKLGIPAPGSAPNVAAPVTPDDTVAPTVSSASVSGAMLLIKFTEERRLDAVNPPPATAFTVTSPTRTFEIASVAIDGPARTCTLNLSEPVDPNEVITLTYKDPTTGDDKSALQDEAGNDVASFTLTVGNDTSDKIGPTFRQALLEPDGVTLKVWFTDANPLQDTNLPATSTFNVLANGAKVNVSSMSIYPPDRCVILTLASAVSVGAVVTVSYTDPTISNDANAIQDTAGNDAQGFVMKPVENTAGDNSRPSMIANSAINNIVNLKFNEKLITNSPAPTRFGVIVNGTNHVPTQVNVDGVDALVVLTIPITTLYGDQVLVTYDAAEDSRVKVLDLSGNQINGFTAFPVVNQNAYFSPYDPNTGGGGGTGGNG
jgi:uncharacterized repeat protein (TIGR02059 family)